MERKEGIIEVRRLSAGSKSDGDYVYLLCGESGDTYRLYREGIHPVSDSSLAQFAGCYVAVEGTVQDDEWMMVDNITELNHQQPEDNNPENNSTIQ